MNTANNLSLEQNSRFQKRANKLSGYKKQRVLELMNELDMLPVQDLNKLTSKVLESFSVKASTNAQPFKLSIDDFICMIDKICDPSVSYLDQTFGRYIFAIELWNLYLSIHHPEEAGWLAILSDRLVY